MKRHLLWFFITTYVTGVAGNLHQAEIQPVPPAPFYVFALTWTDPVGYTLTKVQWSRGETEITTHEYPAGSSPGTLVLRGDVAGTYRVKISTYDAGGILSTVTLLEGIQSAGSSCPNVDPPSTSDPEPCPEPEVVEVQQPAFSWSIDGLTLTVRIYNIGDLDGPIDLRLPGSSPGLVVAFNPFTGRAQMELPGPGRHELFLDGDAFDPVAFSVMAEASTTTAHVGRYSGAGGFHTDLYIGLEAERRELVAVLYSGPYQLTRHLNVPSYQDLIGHQIRYEDVFPGQAGFLVLHSNDPDDRRPVQATMVLTHESTPVEAYQSAIRSEDRGTLFRADAPGVYYLELVNTTDQDAHVQIFADGGVVGGLTLDRGSELLYRIDPGMVGKASAIIRAEGAVYRLLYVSGFAVTVMR